MFLKFKKTTVLGLFLGALVQTPALAESLTVVRTTELKADRYLDATTLATLQAAQAVDSVKTEAGWVQVKVQGQLGWVRAMALKGNNTASVANVATLSSGRSGANNSMSTTGIRSIPKASRHALIIGIGEYSTSGIMPLKGVKHDMQSAKSIAQTMSIPDDNITYLRDEQATAQQIRQAVQDLNSRVRPGDRVFVYYSGHGTRWVDPVEPEHCTEGLLSTDGKAISNIEISDLLAPIASKTDKLLVFYDACHSGGIVNQPMRTRALNVAGAMITPKFVGNMSPEACAKPTNMRTRALSTELSKKGVLPDNIVSIAASRPDEVSFDDARSGGLATVAWRDCMLGKAKDSDGNGMLNVEEITSCAQNSLDQKLKQFPDILGQHMTIGGNKAFIPSYQLAANGNANSALSSVSTSVVAPSLISNGQSIDNSNSATPSLPQPSISTIKPAELLGQIHAQRDAQRSLQVTPSLKSLRILQDPLQVTVQSPRSGYLYMALAGSDEKSLYLLFPNSLDGNNYIEANTPIELPRKGWRITAAGPKGLDTVLVIVADSPRDLSQLASEKAGPFVKTLLNPQGNGQLQWLLGNSANADQKICQEGGTKRNLQVQEACSDAFASVILHIEEKEGQ
jgi:hypothetical protein